MFALEPGARIEVYVRKIGAVLLVRWFLRVATMGARDEEFCDFALVVVLLFRYIG